MVLEEQYDRAQGGVAGGGLGQVVGDFLRGKRITPDDIFRAAGEIFGGFPSVHPAGGARVHPGDHQHRPAWDPRNWDPDWTARQQQHQQQRQRQAQSFDPDLELQRELGAARMELGFQHREPLTVERVEKRRKELARKHHPDLGGSPERMVRINQAADLLVAKGNLG